MSLSDAWRKESTALERALMLQRETSRLGFDWPDARPVFAKTQEEVRELREAWEQGNRAAVAEEAGDVLFACVCLLRHLEVSPETALDAACEKFARRFGVVRQVAATKGLQIETLSPRALEALWILAKARIG